MSIAVKGEPSLTATKEALLKSAALLFSKHGYAAVSMRMIASDIAITPAALYHHYPDKAALYYAVLEFVFTDKAEKISASLAGDGPPEKRLEKLIRSLAELISGDEIFTRLLHRELLDGDEGRVKRLTEDVIEAPFREIEKLIRQLAPRQDERLVSISIISLILGHFELRPVLQNISPRKKDHETLSQFTRRLNAFILFGLQGGEFSSKEAVR